jgi:hypothetical protein
MSSNNVGHPITSTIITLQHFATLHHTSPNYTPLHLSTLHFLSFTLHYPLIWFNPITFPIVLFHLPSLNLTQYVSHIPKLITKIMNPFTALKNLSTFYFTSLFIIFMCVTDNTLTTLQHTHVHTLASAQPLALLKINRTTPARQQPRQHNKEDVHRNKITK